jgi:hypothetical protein
MSIVVVRCPSCKAQSRVGPEAVGVLVVCPLCQSPFLAVEETAPVPPSPPVPPPPPRQRPIKSAEPVAPPTRRPRAEPVAPPASIPAAELEADHGIGRGLPATVLVGLALLPFLIPLLWVLAPAVMGQEPVLSVAAPTALAVAASALCLAVVYTVDWTPTTRVKGVLMLVGLSYFAAASLYYLKKEMVDRVKRFFGAGAEWKEFSPPNGDCKILMPGVPRRLPQLQPLPGWKLECHQGTHKPYLGTFWFTVGYGVDVQPNVPDDEWFEAAKKAALSIDPRRRAVRETPVEQQKWRGREWVFENGDEDETVSVTRVVRVPEKRRVYFVSARGPKLSPDDDEAKAFFDSFLISPPEPKDE